MSQIVELVCKDEDKKEEEKTEECKAEKPLGAESFQTFDENSSMRL